MNDRVQAYFEAVPAARRARLDVLHELIVALFPEAEMTLSYEMPTYRVKSGWVAIANQKHYVSLYTCGAAHIAAFKAKHPRYKTGAGCINFRDTDELPLEDLKQVIRHAIEQPKGC